MQSGQSYAEWVASLKAIARDCSFDCKSEACNHRSFVDEHIRDVITQLTHHAEIRRQCLIEPNISLNDVLSKADLYTKTLETDKLLTGTGGVLVNKMASQYKKKMNHSNKKNTSNCNKKSEWKRCKDCFTNHLTRDCPYKSYTSHRCKKVEQFKSVCKSKVSETKSFPIDKDKEQAVRSAFTCSSKAMDTHYIELTCEIYERVGKQIWLKAEINGKEISCRWDTGKDGNLATWS